MRNKNSRNIAMRSRTSLLIITAALLLTACGSPEKRAADYLVKAQRARADSEVVAA